ncbi:MAG TPA: hypothetical protein VFX70_15810 [Mycobacteriales bacterium]|nr:hypothetical protein [Mycobacteriales bacterium]
MTSDQYAHHAVSPGSVAGVSDVAGAKFGAAVAVGDFDHDGFADVAVGAPADKVGSNASGAVYVLRGTAAGIDTASGTRLTQTNIGAGNEAGDKFGAALAAGDFDKDGFADLAVGDPGEAVGTHAKAGAIALFLGKAAGLTTGKFIDQDLDGASNEAGDEFGTSLAAGDVNGDGFADLAIGTPGEVQPGATAHSGTVFVYKGVSTGLAKGWSESQSKAGVGADEAGDQFGEAVAIGNVTGDSHGDLVVGAPGEAPGTDPANSGAIYVMPGSSTGVAAGFGDSQTGDGGTNEAGDRLGAALAVGDFDKDGHADVAAGVPGEAPDTNPASGSVLVFPGAASKLGHGFWLQEANTGDAPAAADKFGAALAAGDVNGDGFADLLVGAPGKTVGAVSGSGATYLFAGGPRQADSTASMHLGRRIGQTDVGAGNETNDAFGASVAMGDITGDGRADAIIGHSGEAVPGQPASGTATQVSNLAEPATPVTPRLPIEPFAPMSALQASPIPGAALGTVEYAYTDNIGRLVHGHQDDPDNALSVQWTVISGLDAFTGRPALAEQSNGELQVIGHNIEGPDWVNTETSKEPPVWGTWTTPTYPMGSPPVLARQSDGSNVAFAIDAAGELWVLPQNGPNGGYTSWVSLGIGDLAGAPVAVTTANGVQVFVRDTTGDIKTMLYSPDRLVSGCTSLNGAGLTGTPSVVVYPGSVLRVFARAADGSIVTQMQDGTGAFPGVWETVGTFTAAGAPAALLDPLTGKTEVVARGVDGAIWNTGETVQGSGVWRDWAQASQLGDNSATDPTVFDLTNSNGTGWAFVFRNSDNVVRVYEARSSFGALALTAGQHPSFDATTLPAPPGE